MTFADSERTLTFKSRREQRGVAARARLKRAGLDYECDSCGDSIPKGTLYWSVNAFMPHALCNDCGQAAA